MSRSFLINLHNSGSKQQSGFSLCFHTPCKKNAGTYNLFLQEVFNVVVQQGDEPIDVLIDFERAATNAANMQIPQAQVIAWAVICTLFLLMYLTK